jgi:hypothetical protein
MAIRPRFRFDLNQLRVLDVCLHPRVAFGAVESATMICRRKLLIVMSAMAAAPWLSAPSYAQQIVQIERGSPDRTAILDVVRASVQRRLGIKVIFNVVRLTSFGDWAFADVRPRSEAGSRIDYRRTLYAKDFDPEQDSDTVDVLLRRSGSTWAIVEEAFLPTDVVWEEWQSKYKLPRELFFVE